MISLNDIIIDVELLRQRCVFREGFVFTSLANIDCAANIYDAIVIRNPENAQCSTPQTGFSSRSLKEHIAFVNQYRIQKALIIAEDISFITECPSLRYIQVVPADTAQDNFDFSPLYAKPDIYSLSCVTEFGHGQKKKSTIDYSKILGLRDLSVSGTGNLQFDKLVNLKKLNVYGVKIESKDLSGFACLDTLTSLTLNSCTIESLSGIRAASSLETLSLWYNRSLHDILEISSISGNLRNLSIDACGKIKDFSFLYELGALERLELKGSNVIPDLNFLKKMKNLKMFVFSMDVENGDLSPCLSLPYVYSQRNRKHFNLSDKELPKNL